MAPQEQTDADENDNDNDDRNAIPSMKEEKQQSAEAQETKESGENEGKDTCTTRLFSVYSTNEFLIHIVIAILAARAYPPLGADYLYPEITATWIAVCFIFVLAGLGLKTEEFRKAFTQFRFNLVVQLHSFILTSAAVYGLSRAILHADLLSKDLADGMVVCASLPMTINMVLVLTKSSGGDEAAAIFNAAAGNLLGVFLSPGLILFYLGVTGDIDLLTVFSKLALRVVLPVTIGQVLQKTVPVVVAFVKEHKPKFKKVQQYGLVFIIYTVFCKTFRDDSSSSVGDIFLMILFQFASLTTLMLVAWYMMRLFFPNEPKLRVMGLYGCTHKTVAMGVPLINAIYEGHPALGSYTLPLLIWHPMQLVMGTFLAPRLVKFVAGEEERLGIAEGAVDEVEQEEEKDDKGGDDAEAQ